ncbi:hypothetical protein Pla144_24410 [Bythopirellula polymerisocia]|uniref:Uncharacterized protein n=1 Tax=Bythopirellula polymerisocia TaxID=2528003 RepID=A0A5C6CVG6_9BACT|nr:hypothetical protein Pla144_24410 [Bythopirellula polymerisocia]
MATQIATKPIKGETYKCEKCGMELKVTADCNCKDGCPELTCCGEPLKTS